MASKTLEDLFIDCLRQTYFAEEQIARALAKMVKVAGSKELARAFEKHRDETHVQLARLEQYLTGWAARLGRSPVSEFKAYSERRVNLPRNSETATRSTLRSSP
jgi:ferritin-like metal-binding protein YciE